MTETKDSDRPKVYVYAPGADFLLPYLKRELQLSDLTEADAAVMVSSCDIYGEGVFESADETTPVDEPSPWVAREQDFLKSAQAAGLRAYILRCSDVVGTGMTGFVRSLADSIWRGTFFHFPTNEARRSCIHAVDIAAVSGRLVRSGAPEGVYHLTDGDDPTLHDLAEALAFRMCNKRISNLSTGPQQAIGRIIYGKRRYSSYNTTRTFSGRRLQQLIDFKPVKVCDYLRTHVYDSESL